MTTFTLDQTVATPRITDDAAIRLWIARAVGAWALAGTSLIHLLDLPGKIKETPYLGVLYIGLILAAAGLAGRLITRGDRNTWMLSGALAASAIGGYVLSRTTGLPFAGQDIGNWLEPLGLASLFVEGAAVALSISAVRTLARRSPQADRFRC